MANGSFSLCHWAVSSIRRFFHVWIPCLVMLVMAAPSVSHMLPAYDSHLGENYQPLRTLKFFHSHGQEFHKWGPLPNVLLAPVYGATLAWWKVTGSFDDPSDEFPYGFRDPLRQLTVLIAEGRTLFLVAGVLLLGWFLHELGLFAGNRGAVLVAAMLCLATNHVVLLFLPNSRPDGPALAFAAAALGVGLRVLRLGWSPRRAILLAVLSACAVSSKELEATLFLGPGLGLLWWGWRESRGDRGARRNFVVSVATLVGCGLGVYALLNVVYAPQTWLERMQYWLTGSGKDSAVWGGGLGAGGSVVDYAGRIGAAWLNNLGPAGTPIAVVAIATLLALRPRHWLLALLPLLSIQLLGLGPMGYAHDRFYLPAALAATLPVAAGLAALWAATPRRWRSTLAAMALVAVVLNGVYATTARHLLKTIAPALIETHAAGHVTSGDRLNVLDEHPAIAGKSRLAWLGHDVDPRSASEIAAISRDDRPAWIYTSRGKRLFLEEARHYPARAAMLERDSGFDVDLWPGLGPLGYTLVETIVPRTPRWYPYDWMPAPRLHGDVGVVEVWKKELLLNRQP